MNKMNKLTKVEQLKYMIAFYKKYIEQNKKELQELENELKKEENYTLKRKKD